MVFDPGGGTWQDARSALKTSSLLLYLFTTSAFAAKQESQNISYKNILVNYIITIYIQYLIRVFDICDIFTLSDGEEGVSEGHSCEQDPHAAREALSTIVWKGLPHDRLSCR